MLSPLTCDRLSDPSGKASGLDLKLLRDGESTPSLGSWFQWLIPLAVQRLGKGERSAYKFQVPAITEQMATGPSAHVLISAQQNFVLAVLPT